MAAHGESLLGSSSGLEGNANGCALPGGQRQAKSEDASFVSVAATASKSEQLFQDRYAAADLGNQGVDLLAITDSASLFGNGSNR